MSLRLKSPPINPFAHGPIQRRLKDNLELEPAVDRLALGAVAVAVTAKAYQTFLDTDGVTGAGQQVNLPDGDYPGQPKMLTANIVGGADTIVLSAAALAKLDSVPSVLGPEIVTAVAFAADNQFVFMEWTGLKWRLHSWSATVTKSPVDTLQLSGTPAAVTLAAYQTTLLSSTAAAQFTLPDGERVGQRKLLVADVTASGTCIAGASALAKLQRLGMSGETPVAVTGLTFDADGEYALLEWQGPTKWNVVYTTATVAV